MEKEFIHMLIKIHILVGGNTEKRKERELIFMLIQE